jgi:hypothetical protein
VDSGGLSRLLDLLDKRGLRRTWYLGYLALVRLSEDPDTIPSMQSPSVW